MYLRRNKGQVAAFMVLIVGVLILAIVATMLIGEVGFQRIRLANVADSAVISAASALCRSLNQIRMAHTGMFLNWIAQQTALLCGPVGGAWPDKWSAQAVAFYFTMRGQQAFQGARSIANKATKDLRVGLYESVLSSALVDEPKPFIDIPLGNPRGNPPDVDCNDPAQAGNLACDEVEREGGYEGKITFLNYKKYLKRDSHFTTTFRDYKKSDQDGWFRNHALTYYWNTIVDPATDRLTAGVLVPPAQQPAPAAYQSYLRVDLANAPNRVTVVPFPMLLFFMYCQPCIFGCCWLPGFSINPFAWIMSVNIDNDRIELRLTKQASFRRLPFFSRTVVLQHRSAARVPGSVWVGWQFSMEQ